MLRTKTRAVQSARRSADAAEDMRQRWRRSIFCGWRIFSYALRCARLSGVCPCSNTILITPFRRLHTTASFQRRHVPLMPTIRRAPAQNDRHANRHAGAREKMRRIIIMTRQKARPRSLFANDDNHKMPFHDVRRTSDASRRCHFRRRASYTIVNMRKIPVLANSTAPNRSASQFQFCPVGTPREIVVSTMMNTNLHARNMNSENAECATDARAKPSFSHA